MQKDSSEGKINCYNLLNEINQKDLKFSVEKVNVSGQPFRTFDPISKSQYVYLRIVQSDERPEAGTEDYYDDKFWEKLIAATPLKSWQQLLPDTKDLQQHSVEIKIDALPAGRYVLIASSEKDFNVKKGIIGARFFYVSNISYVNNGRNYFVLNRETGQPLVGATVQSWERQYDYKTSKYISEKGKSFKTDENGYFSFERKNDATSYGSNYLLDITYNNDRLFMNDDLSIIITAIIQSILLKKISLYFFLPIVLFIVPVKLYYFKGIAISKMTDETTSTIKTDYETKIYSA